MLCRVASAARFLRSFFSSKQHKNRLGGIGMKRTLGKDCSTSFSRTAGGKPLM